VDNEKAKKRFCSSRCGALSKPREFFREISLKQHDDRQYEKYRHVLAFIEDMTGLEIFNAGVRLGYELRDCQARGVTPGRHVVKLTREACQE
jgi:hypothetical protein